MTTDEINEIMDASSNGKLTDWQCRSLVHYMIGYLRYAQGDVENTRQQYFRQIKAATEGKNVPIW